MREVDRVATAPTVSGSAKESKVAPASVPVIRPVCTNLSSTWRNLRRDCSGRLMGSYVVGARTSPARNPAWATVRSETFEPKYTSAAAWIP